MTKKVYLAGPIHGKNDAECNGWRMAAGSWLQAKGFEVLDPMARDYRGAEDENVHEIVNGDLSDIDACLIVLVNANGPSWGTAMELVYAKSYGKRVVAFATHTNAPRISPWLRWHTHAIYESLQTALNGITENSMHGRRE